MTDIAAVIDIIRGGVISKSVMPAQAGIQDGRGLGTEDGFRPPPE